MTKPIGLLIAAAALCAFPSVTFAAASDTFVVRNVSVHPVTGPQVDNTSVLVIDGKIAEIGPKVVAAKTIKVIDGKGLHLYPGMINAGTEVGLDEINAIRESVDANEIGEFDPQLHATVAVNPSSEHIPVTRANGITTVIVLPATVGGGEGRRGGGATQVISGQSGLMHLDGWTWEEMTINRNAAMEMKFPFIQTIPARFAEMAALFGMPRGSYAESKRNYEKTIQQTHEFFEDARRYQKAKAAHEPNLATNLRYEAMIPILDGKEPMMVMAAKAKTVKEAIDFADREKIKIVIAGVDEMGDYAAKLKEKNIPVICGPTLELPNEEDDPYDQKATLPGQLYKAGVKIAFASFDVEFARNLPYQAATAVAYGLPYEEALKAVTINPAEIFGVSDRIGSIEKGKWADMILTDGDPLETKTEVKHMFIKGHDVDLTSRHTRLYEKYMSRQ
ncbi:MAG TPA: amidohydrolase family protein [Bryobacteraceae bacterium]|jgi:imidazolonepropionase-like amidohydrolase